MLDLKILVRSLADRKIHQYVAETLTDQEAINAIADQTLDMSDRKATIVRWLDHYKVLMSYTYANRSVVADQIIGFADKRDPNFRPDNSDALISEFTKLQDKIKSVVPRNLNGEARDTTSLTTKALWCCYPDAVPIYDRNAAVALGVISRLCGMVTQPGIENEYAGFLDLWFQVYRETDDVLCAIDLDNCPYKIRALDRFLWYLGQKGCPAPD